MITRMSLTIDSRGKASGRATAIRAEAVSVHHGSQRALGDVTFEVPTGSTLAVIGPNGSGKSTLLGALAGLNEVSTGVLEVPARNRRGGVALVLQSTDVERSLPITVRETVKMARYARLGLLGRCTSTDREAVGEALERVGAGDLEWLQLQELSGGQRQRVLVAQGLAQHGELLLLDEPLTGLDLVAARMISMVISEESAAGRTVVFTTHDLDDARRADNVLLLATRQVAFGPPGDVLTPGPLREAFGGNVLHLDDGSVVLDDPHHVHGHRYGSASH